MRITELDAVEYNPFYQPYLDVLGDVELFDILVRQLGNFPKFLESIPEEKLGYSYAKGKWSIAEVLVHIFDTERVFQYRALRLMRGDKTPLPGFDQDLFAPNSNAGQRTKKSIIEEYDIVRRSTIALFSNMNRKTLHVIGEVSNGPMSVAALGFIMCGHQKHHRNVIRERYLSL
jgi:hypothetical protein